MSVGAALSAALLPLRLLAAERDVFDLSIEELMQIPVVTATRQQQTLAEAPAVVSVIRIDELRLHGYRSVADALAQVPGLYGIDDGVSTSFGVRGVANGLRAANRLFKVLIDGQPVQFRFDGTHSLGLEFIPLSVIDRIEIVRGPASALYGADAFLGVINVITRQANAGGGRLAVDGLRENSNGGLVDLRLTLSEGRWQAQLALQAASHNYDGRELPASSPLLALFGGDTHADDANFKPRAGLFRLHGEWQHHRSDFYWHGTRVDSVAEFGDFGALSHHNRLATEQNDFWWQGQWTLAPNWLLDTRLAHRHGEPSSREHLTLAAESGTHAARQFSFDALEASAQLSWQQDNYGVHAGVDISNDREQLMRVFSVDERSDIVTPQGPDQGHQTFRNRGLFAQYQQQLWPDLTLTLNARHDQHNLFGNDDSGRVALVWQVNEQFGLKALYGNSYRAPSAAQLFAQPLYAGDVVANPDLKPERAYMQELAFDWRPASSWLWRGNVYRLSVQDKIEVLLDGGEHTPQNVTEQEGWGLESELHWQGQDQSLQAQLAWQDTEESTADVFRGELHAPTERYPRAWWRLAWEYRFIHGSELSLSVRGASPRRASKENSTENRLTPYQLPSYQLWRLNWRLPLAQQGWQLTIDNLSNERYAEPGFAGIDLPGRGRYFAIGWYLEWGAP